MVSTVAVFLWAGTALAVLGLAGAVAARIYARGFVSGMRREAAGWMEAMTRVRPPNWQSLPHRHPDDRQLSEDFNKLYASAYGMVFGQVFEDLMAARSEALAEDIRRGTLLEPPGNA